MAMSEAREQSKRNSNTKSEELIKTIDDCVSRLSCLCLAFGRKRAIALARILPRN